MTDSVAIVSGGMDSVTLLHHLVKTDQRQPAVITFLYGQKHDREVDCARHNVARTRPGQPYSCRSSARCGPFSARRRWWMKPSPFLTLSR